MTKTDLLQFKKILNQAVTPLKKILDQHGKKFEQIDKKLGVIDKRSEKVDERLDIVVERLDTAEERLDTITGSVMAIENKMDIVLDIHQELKGQKGEIEKHEERITVLEEHVSI